jgi:hypothetical protein
MMVGPDGDGAYALFPLKGVVLENLFRSIGVITTGGALAVVSLFTSTGTLFFFFL